MSCNLKVEKTEKAFRISAEVKNTGDRAGDEIVQCYVQDVVAKRVRPVKELKDFAKVSLEPGEEKEVVFEIPFEKLGYYDREMNYVVEPGLFRFYVGGNSRDTLMAESVL